MEFEDLKVEVPLEDEETNESPLFDVPIKKYQNNDGNFVIGFDVTSKEAQEKRLKRAHRFGIKAESAANQQEIEALPSCVAELPKTVKDAEIRCDAILLFGVNEMSTKDVFDYFKHYMPGSIEWIDDMSCVVVWEDENSAKRALVNMGTKFTPPKDKESNEEELENIWKIGNKHPKSKQLLMRYATKSDKKVKGAGSRSLYYLIHGNPTQQSQKGKKRGLVSSSRKRKIAADRLRISEELDPTPEVEILDMDDVDMDETADHMDVDEPPVKVVISEDSTGDRIPRGNLYADQEMNSTKPARSRLKKRLEQDEAFLNDGGFSTDPLPRSAKMDQASDARQRIKNKGNSSTKNTQFQDLRQKLKNRREGFNPKTRPNLSIEVTED